MDSWKIKNDPSTTRNDLKYAYKSLKTTGVIAFPGYIVAWAKNETKAMKNLE